MNEFAETLRELAARLESGEITKCAISYQGPNVTRGGYILGCFDALEAMEIAGGLAHVLWESAKCQAEEIKQIMALMKKNE